MIKTIPISTKRSSDVTITTYDDQALTNAAERMISCHASGVPLRYLGFTIEVTNKGAKLVAHGQALNGQSFSTSLDL